MTYTQALQKRKKVTIIPPGMTRDRAEAAISAITGQLRGPMPNVQRIMLVHDREDFRDIIALFDENSNV